MRSTATRSTDPAATQTRIGPRSDHGLGIVLNSS
jgi:hypothetical protein